MRTLALNRRGAAQLQMLGNLWGSNMDSVRYLGLEIAREVLHTGLDLSACLTWLSAGAGKELGI
jgi:hypothetical protein